jgi:hypothetical protein
VEFVWVLSILMNGKETTECQIFGKLGRELVVENQVKELSECGKAF